MASPPAKKAKLTAKLTYAIDGKGSKVIGTHSGSFHCDEALAVWILHQTEEFADSPIVRTRDMKLLETLDANVDVGATYDPARHRYDHHQRGFEETLDVEHKVKLSSAGLVYKHFGKEVLAKKCGLSLEDKTLEVIYQRFYTVFVEGIDGIDNGVQRYPADLTAAYQENTNLAARVGRLNPAWNDESADESAQFAKAVAITGEEFESMLNVVHRQWLPARALVEDALKKRFDVDASGEIMVFSKGGCPWKDHLVALEEENQISGQVKFTLYQDQSGSWRIQTVPLTPGSFAFRKSIFKDWCGVRDEELSKKSGIPDCVFVHANGFIGGNKTFDGALEMARKSLAA